MKKEDIEKYYVLVNRNKVRDILILYMKLNQCIDDKRFYIDNYKVEYVSEMINYKGNNVNDTFMICDNNYKHMENLQMFRMKLRHYISNNIVNINVFLCFPYSGSESEENGGYPLDFSCNDLVLNHDGIKSVCDIVDASNLFLDIINSTTSLSYDYTNDNFISLDDDELSYIKTIPKIILFLYPIIQKMDIIFQIFFI